MSTSEPTVAAGLAEALLSFAASRGADPRALRAAAAIPEGALDDLEHRLALSRFIALVQAARAATGDPALALRFGAEADIAAASVAGLIGRSAQSMSEAFALLNRYGRLIVDVDHEGPERFRLLCVAGRHWVLDTRRDPAAHPELNEYTFARLAAVGRQLFPGEHYLEKVEFAHSAPSHAAAYEGILGAPVRFRCKANRMRFDPAALERRIAVREPAYAHAIFAKHAEELLARLDARVSVSRRVEQLLDQALPGGPVDQEQAAQRLGLSRRTLHRRLRDEGTSFGRLLEKSRRRLAAEHLAAGLSVKRTAHLLGFSDPAAFSRAYKRWTGASPVSARRSPG